MERQEERVRVGWRGRINGEINKTNAEREKREESEGTEAEGKIALTNFNTIHFHTFIISELLLKPG